MGNPLLQYEVGITGQGKMRRELAGITSEIRKNAKAQAQSEVAAAHAREKAASRTAKLKQAIAKAEAKSVAGMGRDEVAGHRLRMRAMQQELRVLNDKDRLLRKQGRTRDQEHAKTMRGIRDESAALSKKTSHLDSQLAGRGIHINSDLAASRGMPFAIKTAQNAKLRERVVGARDRINSAGGRTAAGIASNAMGYATLGGGLAVGSAIYQQADIASRSSSLANQGFVEGGPSRDEIFKKIQRTTGAMNDRYGVDQGAMIGGMEAFVDKTGNVDMALNMADHIAQLSSASGADMSELGTVLGNAFSNLKQTPGVSEEQAVDQAKQLSMILAGQGKIGAVEMRDLANRAPILTSAASQFGGDRMESMAVMGALAQIAVDKGGAHNADVATTSIKNLPLDMVMKGKKAGMTGDVAKMNPVDAIVQLLEKTGGDKQKLLKVVGRETLPSIEGLRKTWEENGGKKDGSGSKAVRKEIQRYVDAAYSKGEMQDSAAFRGSQMDRQIDRAMGQFNIAVGTQLVPAVTDLIPAITSLTPIIANVGSVGADFVSFAANDPFAGLSAIFAASMAKQAAGVGLARIMESSLGKNLAAGGLVIGTLYGAVQLAEFAVQEMDKSADDRYSKDRKALDTLAGKAQAELAATGQVSPETKAQLIQSTELLKQREISAVANRAVREESSGFTNWVSDTVLAGKTGVNTAAKFFDKDAGPVFEQDYEEAAQKKSDANNLEDLGTRIAQLQAAIDGNKEGFGQLTKALSDAADKMANAASAGGGDAARNGSPISARD